MLGWPLWGSPFRPPYAAQAGTYQVWSQAVDIVKDQAVCNRSFQSWMFGSRIRSPIASSRSMSWIASIAAKVASWSAHEPLGPLPKQELLLSLDLPLLPAFSQDGLIGGRLPHGLHSFQQLKRQFFREA